MTLGFFLLLLTLHGGLAAFLIARLLRYRFEPSAMLVWVLLILFVPFIGALLYARLGENQVLIRAQRKRGRSCLPDYELEDHTVDTKTLGAFRSTADVGLKLSHAQVTRGNTVTLLRNSDAIHESWKSAINEAESTIHMEYYIWWADETGTEMRDLLIARARDGVRCRVLIDAVGSINVNSAFLQPFYDAGIDVAFFLPLATWKRRWSPHLRNHRKILVVDGQTGFVGSQNVSDDDRGKNPEFSIWHNVHLRITGPAVRRLQAVFLDDWNFASDARVDELPTASPVSSEVDHAVQILPTGPDCKAHVPERMLLEAFNSAKDSIDVATPYFVPSPVLRMGLLQAALRGVRVRIVVPAKTDQAIALYAGRSFYRELLDESIEIYEYHRGMLHSKIIAVDGVWAMVGSVNMDYRSLRLNFEISALLYDEEPVHELTEVVAEYRADAKPITSEAIANKGRWQVILEGAARVLSPQL